MSDILIPNDRAKVPKQQSEGGVGMAVTVNCFGCGKRIAAKETLAGKRVKCPACSRTVQLPALGPTGSIKSAMPAPAAPIEPRQTNEPPKIEASASAAATKQSWLQYWAGMLIAGLVAFNFTSRTSHNRPATHSSQSSSVGEQLKQEAAPPRVRPTPAPIPTVPSVLPTKDVDERLFLSYVLHDLYSAWPTTAGDPERLQTEVLQLRRRADRFRDYAESKLRDPELARLFADCLGLLDAYADLLAESGRIERQSTARENVERGDAGFNAGFAGGSIAADAYGRGATGEDAALAGLAAGVFQFLLEENTRGQARDEAKRAAIERAKRAFEAKVSAVDARLQNAEAELAAKHGWRSNEVRSADGEGETKELEAMEKRNDHEGVVRMLDRKIARRPRDAWLLARRDYLSVAGSSSTPAQLKAAAERCSGRIALVPAGRIYDSHRAQVAFWASDLANRAWSKQLEGQAWGWAASDLAAYAVSLWDLTLALAPGDEDGECRERRAWALMASGRIKEARIQADEVRALRGNTVRYAMNNARLADADNDTAKALEWMSYAVKSLGFNDVRQAKSDPDLAATRRSQAAAFDDLFSVKWAWAVNFGVFKDDIVVENRSAFPITNVELNCEIQSGGKSWSPRLKCNRIEPGHVHKWVNVLSIPSGRTDSGTAALLCDQNR